MLRTRSPSSTASGQSFERRRGLTLRLDRADEALEGRLGFHSVNSEIDEAGRRVNLRLTAAARSAPAHVLGHA